jgi:BolA protein
MMIFPSSIPYIGAMSMNPTGPVAAEIARRLTDALSPAQLAVIDDSEKHRGHAGHDGAGESHFTVEIVSASFAGKNRVERQRAVNHALADLLAERVHALAIKARAPGE